MHPLFAEWPMPQLGPSDFDQALAAHSDQLVMVFFWGHNCPNCEVAKRTIHEEIENYKKFPIHWYHVNTYQDSDLGIRFGLHGIPTFLFFKNGRLLARATSYPGHEEFTEILTNMVEKHLGA